MFSSPPRLVPAAFPVTSTSTMVPGITNPATPTTSFTATESARIPSGIVAGSPAPDCVEASLLSRIGSFSATGVISARFAQSSIRVNIPETGSLDGHGISRRLLESTRVPNCSGCDATTMCCMLTGLTVLAFLNARYTKELRIAATTTAKASPMSIRLRFIKEISLAPVSSAPAGRAVANHRGCRHRHPKWQFQQSRIVQRNFRILAQPERQKSANQHKKISHRAFHALRPHHFHHGHQSRHQNASQQYAQEQDRSQERSQGAHQFPVTRAERAQQHQRKQETQSQTGSCERSLGSRPARHQGMHREAKDQRRSGKPIGNLACMPVRPPRRKRQGYRQHPDYFGHKICGLVLQPDELAGPSLRFRSAWPAVLAPRSVVLEFNYVRFVAAFANTPLIAVASTPSEPIAANATSTNSNAYSVRSCPSSSFQSLARITFMLCSP